MPIDDSQTFGFLKYVTHSNASSWKILKLGSAIPLPELTEVAGFTGLTLAGLGLPALGFFTVWPLLLPLPSSEAVLVLSVPARLSGRFALPRKASGGDRGGRSTCTVGMPTATGAEGWI